MQASHSATQTLDEIAVAGPEERERGPGARINLGNSNQVTVSLDGTIHVDNRLMLEQEQIRFLRKSTARQLPDRDDRFSRVNRRLHLQLVPDRLIALDQPLIQRAGYEIAPNVSEPDGVPAHIPFGPDLALVNLEYVRIGDSPYLARLLLPNSMHPETRRCEALNQISDFWPADTHPYVLLGKTLKDCNRAARRREGDLVFAENIPDAVRQSVLELYDPIASRVANRLGSEPGNLFVAWWPESAHDGYRFQLSWARNSLLLLEGSAWQQGFDAAQREALRLSFMREQIQRRIREVDWRGPFTQSAVNYLLLLTSSEDDHTTARRLTRELPGWITGCAGRLQTQAPGGTGQDVTATECGLVLQFVYDAVARSKSAGKRSIYDTWRELLDAAFRRRQSGARPAEFLASSADARRIVKGLVDGHVDWSEFAAALDGVGVKLRVAPGAAAPQYAVQSLEYFRD